MSSPTHTIVETASFTNQMNRLGVSESERAAIYDYYAADPDYGSILRRTGGLRKGRIAKDGTGKSGGYRVFSYRPTPSQPVFLLWIIDKSRDEALTEAQEAMFKQLTAVLKQECR